MDESERVPEWSDVDTDDALLQMLGTLPMEGKVTASEDQVVGSGIYWCVELEQAWQDAADDIARALERIHMYDKSVKDSWEALKGYCVRTKILTKEAAMNATQLWITPPGPHGLHITLSTDQRKELIGKSIRFSLSRGCSYQSNALGSPSPLDASLLPCRWFAVRLEFTAWVDGSALCLPSCGHKPHISLALLSLRP